MLFILYNNVVLSLFLRAFCCIFCTVFCILYTYFLHILYTFYTYFSHFIHFSCYFSSNIARLWPNITHFCVFLIHFRAFFLLISYNFLYICTNIACISMHTRAVFRFASFFIFCTFVQTFSTHCTKIAFAKRTALHKLFPACRRTFSSL